MQTGCEIQYTCTAVIALVTSYGSVLLDFGSIFEAHRYVVALAIHFSLGCLVPKSATY
jgi:hypothetical protein